MKKSLQLNLLFISFLILGSMCLKGQIEKKIDISTYNRLPTQAEIADKEAKVLSLTSPTLITNNGSVINGIVHKKSDGESQSVNLSLQKLSMYSVSTNSNSDGLKSTIPPNTPVNAQNVFGSVARVTVTGLEQNCDNAIPVCSSSYTQSTSYTGPGTVQELNSTCLGTNETNSVWYTFTSQNAGTFGFLLSTLKDYDWALFDITASSCANIPSMTPVRCNFSGTLGNTGMDFATATTGAVNTSTPSTGAPISTGISDMLAGHTYVLVIDNYSADANGYVLNFTGTALITDITRPTINPPSTVVNNCNGTFTLLFSEPVKCSSIAANGSDFTITGGGSVISAVGVGCSTGAATTNSVTITYTVPSSGTFTLGVASGTDGNTLLDKCSNAMLTSQTVTLNTINAITLTSNVSQICVPGTAVTLTAIGAPNSIASIYTVNPGPQVASSNGSGQATFTVNPGSTTTYFASATFAGCTRTASVTITVPLSIIAIINPINPTICSGTTVLTGGILVNGVADPGATFQWSGGSALTTSTIAAAPGTYNVTGASSTGCVATNTATSIVSLASAGAGANCNIYYASPAGGGTGLIKSSPTTLQNALTLALCQSAIIKMQTGLYTLTDKVDVNSYVTMEGGYNAAYTTKTSDQSAGGSTRIVRSAGTADTDDGTSKRYTAFKVVSSATGFRLQDLRIEMPTTHAAGSQKTNYGIYLGTGCTNYNIVRCYIDAGTGANGTSGTSGTSGNNGGNGVVPAFCPNAGAVGSGGGVGNAGGLGGNGSSGGSNQTNGTAGSGTAGGAGGAKSVFSDSNCNCDLFNFAGSNGQNGSNGANGIVGAVGSTGAVASYLGGYFVPGVNGTSGNSGTDGSGGGGGGGGTLNQRIPLDGAPGGSGGGGGGKGNGGNGGTAGGGAFGIFSAAKGAGGSVVDCQIVSVAGTGGAGGAGGAAGTGGNGANMTGLVCGFGSNGGYGGSGGNGGAGGAGGAGGVGSAGLACDVCDLVGAIATNAGYVSVNLVTQPIITASNFNCTNTTITNTNASLNSCTSLGANATLVAPALPSSAASITNQYTTPYSRKTIVYAPGGGVYKTYTDFTNIFMAPPSSGSILGATPLCTGVTGNFNSSLGTAAGFTYVWSVVSPAGCSNVIASNLTYSTGITFTNPLATAQIFTVNTAVTSECCGLLAAPTQFTVNVNPDPVVPTVSASANPICPGANSTLNATAPAGCTFQWYNAAVAGTLLSGNAIYSVTPAATTIYYAQATSSLGCPGARTAITVTVTATSPPTVSNISTCAPGNITMNVSSPIAGATYNWYTGSCGGVLVQSSISTALIVNIPAVQINTYYVSVTGPGGCAQSLCTTVTAQVTAAPASVTWTGAGTTGLNNWFDGNNWASSLGVAAQTLSSGAINMALADNNCSGATSNLNASGYSSTVASSGISVTINITHTWDSDLYIFLTAPNGNILELSTGNGANGDNYTATVFSDGGATNITTGTAPFTGTFKPEGSLAASGCAGSTGNVTTFAAIGGGSINPNGNWTLFVSDHAAGDIGTLVSWSISFPGAVASGFCIPSCATDVTIPNTPALAVSNPPDIGFSASGAAATHTLSLVSGNTLSFSDTKAELDICGDFTHAGTLTTNAKGKVVFMGTVAQTYNNSNAVSNTVNIFNDVILNNTAGTPQLTVSNKNMTLGTVGSFVFQSGKILTTANDTLVILNGSTGAVSGHAATRYVGCTSNTNLQGNIKRYIQASGLGSYDFPVGQATYELVNINFTTAPATPLKWLNANFQTWGAVPASPAVTECAATYNMPALNNGFWDITSFNSPNNTGIYDMTLFNSGYTNASMGWSIMSRHNGSATWAMTNGSGSSGFCFASPVTAVLRKQMNGFSKFGTAQSSVPLPIELLSFTVNYNGKSADIRWVTAAEINNDYFVVEKSMNAIDFNFLKQVDSKAPNGNSNSILNYAINDPDVTSGTYYYRLKQYDFNGTASYSSIESITIDESSENIFSVIPNPTSNSADVSYYCYSTEKAVLRVYDDRGRLVIEKEISCSKGQNKSNISLDSEADGLYVITLTTSNNIYKTKLVKRNN